jgi:hypothetical protein
MMEESEAGSGSVRVTNETGCGSGRPKNIRILRTRIPNIGQQNTDFRARNLSLTSALRRRTVWSDPNLDQNPDLINP